MRRKLTAALHLGAVFKSGAIDQGLVDLTYQRVGHGSFTFKQIKETQHLEQADQDKTEDTVTTSHFNQEQDRTEDAVTTSHFNQEQDKTEDAVTTSHFNQEQDKTEDVATTSYSSQEQDKTEETMMPKEAQRRDQTEKRQQEQDMELQKQQQDQQQTTSENKVKRSDNRKLQSRRFNHVMGSQRFKAQEQENHVQMARPLQSNRRQQRKASDHNIA